jgi:F0F1-type ATP synthase assembly protein I
MAAFVRDGGLEAASLGWELAIPIVGGALAGHYLDRWLETKPILTLGLLLLGTVSAFYNVFRFAAREGRAREEAGGGSVAGCEEKR